MVCQEMSEANERKESKSQNSPIAIWAAPRAKPGQAGIDPVYEVKTKYILITPHFFGMQVGACPKLVPEFRRLRNASCIFHLGKRKFSELIFSMCEGTFIPIFTVGVILAELSLSVGRDDGCSLILDVKGNLHHTCGIVLLQQMRVGKKERKHQRRPKTEEEGTPMIGMMDAFT